jgi:sugar phosphate isomerase/epimerase
MKLSVVLSTQSTQFQAVTFTGDLENSIARISGMGYDGVELHIRDPRSVRVEELEALLKRYRLAVSAIGTGQAWSEEGLSLTSADAQVRRAAIERVKSHVLLAARLKAVILLGLIRGTTTRGVSKEQSIDWLVQSLLECMAPAVSEGVQLALEPLNRYETGLINTVEEDLDLLARVGSSNLGLLLDTFHMNIEEPSIDESIRLAKGRLFHFHVADSNRRYPGSGHLDFARLVQTLREIGYSGYVSGEFMPIPDAVTAAQRAIDHLRPLLHG